MHIQSIEEIIVWQKSRVACAEIYKEFRSSRDFRFRDQIQSAAVSVMNNIAEGYERRGIKELAKFLYISKGSAGEVRSMLYLALDLGYISAGSFKKFSQAYLEISRMLGGFIRAL